MAKAVREGNVSKLSVLKPLLVGLAVFSAIVVVLQRDLGSAFVLICMVGIMAFVAGLPHEKLLIIAGIAVYCLVFSNKLYSISKR